MQEGKSVTVNEKPSNTDAYPISNGVNQLLGQSKQNGIHTGDNNEAQITAADAIQKLLSHPLDKQIG